MMQNWLIGFDPRGPHGTGWFVEAADGERHWARLLIVLVPMRCVVVEASPRPRGYGEVYGALMRHGDVITVAKEGSDDGWSSEQTDRGTAGETWDA